MPPHTYIGLSAEELVGKHTPLGRVSQQINDIEQSIDNNSTNEIDLLEETESSDIEKNVQSVGRLNIVVSENEIDTNDNKKDVGKLHIEGEHTFEESFEGTFAFPKSKKEIDIQSDKEGFVDTRTSEHITEDTKTDNDATIEDTEEDNNANSKDIKAETEEDNAIEVTNVEVVSYTVDDDLDQVENQTNMSNGLTLAPVINQSREEERVKPPTTRRRRVVCFLIILLSVIIAAVVLGIVFGSSSDKDDIGEQVCN